MAPTFYKTAKSEEPHLPEKGLEMGAERLKAAVPMQGHDPSETGIQLQSGHGQLLLEDAHLADHAAVGVSEEVDHVEPVVAVVASVVVQPAV
jgi:hypothetical protein